MKRKAHLLPQDKTQVLVRLSIEQYKALEGKFGKPIPSDSTSDIKAGYMLGVQDVLRVIREGWTIGA